MFTTSVRLALVTGSVIAGCLLLIEGQSRPGWLLLIGAAILAFGYFRSGTVWLAFRAEKEGRFDKAAKLLAQTRRPEWLAPQQRAYYHLLRGMASYRSGAFRQARIEFESAVNGKLRTDNDRALALVMLAASELEDGDRPAALSRLEAAKRLSKRQEISQMLESVEEQAAVRRPLNG